MSKNISIQNIIGFIDLTSLEGKDNIESIKILCEKALQKHDAIPSVAAVCVYPTLVHVAKKELQNSKIKIASVAGAFPSGLSPLKIKLQEIKFALDKGADEIDMVISRGKFLENNFCEVHDEIAAIKEICKDKTLKVILETGELITTENIKKASEIAIEAGADFIKTSTGKISVSATIPAVEVMLNCIKTHYQKTNKKIGIKPSGGIKDAKTAMEYLSLTSTILGGEWLTPSLFRYGASSLYDNIISGSNNSKIPY